MKEQKTVELCDGWVVTLLVDDDGHLNVYITNDFCDEDIMEIESGQGDGTVGDQLALRFTTTEIEQAYIAENFVKGLPTEFVVLTTKNGD